MDWDIFASSASASAFWDSRAVFFSSAPTMVWRRVLICSLFSAIELSKVCLKDSCSSMSSCAFSTESFSVARTILASSIFFLSSLYSGPILAAISSSLAATSMALASRACTSSAWTRWPSSIAFSVFPTCSELDCCFAVSIWSLRCAYCAFALSRASFASR